MVNSNSHLLYVQGGRHAQIDGRSQSRASSAGRSIARSTDRMIIARGIDRPGGYEMSAHDVGMSHQLL